MSIDTCAHVQNVVKVIKSNELSLIHSYGMNELVFFFYSTKEDKKTCFEMYFSIEKGQSLGNVYFSAWKHSCFDKIKFACFSALFFSVLTFLQNEKFLRFKFCEFWSVWKKIQKYFCCRKKAGDLQCLFFFFKVILKNGYCSLDFARAR